MAVDAGNGVNSRSIKQVFGELTFTHILDISGNGHDYTIIRQTFHESLPPLCVFVGTDAGGQFVRMLEKVWVRRRLGLSV